MKYSGRRVQVPHHIRVFLSRGKSLFRTERYRTHQKTKQQQQQLSFGRVGMEQLANRTNKQVRFDPQFLQEEEDRKKEKKVWSIQWFARSQFLFIFLLAAAAVRSVAAILAGAQTLTFCCFWPTSLIHRDD